jgi:hypothetical protein
VKSGLSVNKNVLFRKFAPLRPSFGRQKGNDFPSGISVSVFTRLFRTEKIARIVKRRLPPWFQKRLGVSLLTLYLICSAGAADACMLLTPECFTTFLTGLEKPWYGRATLTPVGPRPYGITFKRHPQGHLEGAARPSEISTHYWTFYQEDQALKLRFLSTFAGNTQPLLLRATEVVKNTWIFKSSQPRFLEVHVKPQAQALDIAIFLRGERHVEIHLKHRLQ